MKNKIVILFIVFFLALSGFSNAALDGFIFEPNFSVAPNGLIFSDSVPAGYCEGAVYAGIYPNNIGSLASATNECSKFFPIGFWNMQPIPGDYFITLSNGVDKRYYGPITCSGTADECRNINGAGWVAYNQKTPVLIVPGLLGTEMKKGDELLWPDATRMLTNISDNFMDPLQFDNNLNPTDDNVTTGSIIGSPAVGQHFYDFLIEEFTAQDYTENETLFTFPYDWRYGVSGVYVDGRTNVDLLKQKIDDILQQTGANKVDVVAHSLGGLIVKKYAMDNPADNHIGKAVFVGVPNTGAPKAVKVLLQGDNFGVLGLNDAEIKKISENMPAAYDLLPSQEYYADNGAFVKTVNVDVGNLIYEENDLDYQQTKSFITHEHNFNSQGMTNAESLRSNVFDNFDLRTAGIDLYSINGCKSGTINKITETTKTDVFGYTTINYDIHKIGAGDGTVPLSSAENLLVDDSNVFYAKYADHGKMPSQNGIKEKIVNIVSGSSLNTGNNIITKSQLQANPNICELNGFWLLILSPVSIEIADQNGNRAGIAEDGSIQNQIPGADYQVMGEHKFVYLPAGENQNYTINLKGEDIGTFTLKNSQITNGETTQTEIFSNLPVTENLIGQVVFSASAGQPTILLLDTDGNSTTDQSVEPSSVLDATQSDDLLPPLSTLTITGEQGQPSFYRSNAQIQISAADDNSGILAINYNLDDTDWQKAAPPAGGAAELTVSDQGIHTITYFSTDRAGNNEPEKTTTFTVDTTHPEAIIEFDPSAKTLKFTGIDNISTKDQIIIQDQGDKISLNDQAGNTTKLILPAEETSNALYPTQNTGNQINFRIKRIRYNGNIINDSRIDMDFSWTLRRNQNIKTLIQDFEIVYETCSDPQLTQNSINTNTGDPQTCQTASKTITADYDGTQTKITTISPAETSAQTFSGLKIIKITTNQGNFGWGD